MYTCVLDLHVFECELTSICDVKSKLPTVLQREVLEVKVFDGADDAEKVDQAGYVCVRACVLACVRACVRACVCVCACVRVRV